MPASAIAGSPTPVEDAFSEGAVWLVTGGLGGVGLVLARHLAERCRAKLVLVGRTPVPAKQEWNTWLATQSAGHRTSKIIAALRAIEACGSEVLVLAADVSDHASMQYVADRARARFGRVDGVIHAAGVADLHPLQGLDAEALRRGAAAKVAAVAHLHALFGDTLRCMLLCSSQNAFKGGIGKYSYCVANAYLDAWAEAHAAEVGYRLVSLSWCTWREAGMAIGAGGEPLDERRQRESISNAEAVELFEQAVRLPLPRLVVSKLPLAAVLDEFDDAQHAQRLSMIGHASPCAAGSERPASLGSDYVAPASLVEQQICEIWTEVLGVDPVGALDNFFELGGSSLLLTQVALRVKQRFGGVSLQGLFAALTVREQAAHVIALQAQAAGGDELDAMLAELEALSDDEISGMLNA